MFETSIYTPILYNFFKLLMVDTPFFLLLLVSFGLPVCLALAHCQPTTTACLILIRKPTRSIHKIQSRFLFRSQEILQYTLCLSSSRIINVEIKAVKTHAVICVSRTILGICTRAKFRIEEH